MSSFFPLSPLFYIARKLFVTVVLAVVFVNTACAQSVAFTFDDGPKLNQTPKLTPAARNQALLDALSKHRVKAALFVSAINGVDQPEGLELGRAWGKAGHFIGNHTVTHLDLNRSSVTLAQYQQEVVDCDAIISTIPGYRKWFRFTYLREGNTPEKRDGMRAFLRAQSYSNGYVSLDTSDWRLDEKLIEVLSKNIDADISPIKRAYLAHIWQRAQAYRDLSRTLQGRDIPQVLLLHHNLINALWLNDIISMFKNNGWTIVSPETAFADSVYQLQPDQAWHGQSLLLSMARSLGLHRFEGWERLVDDGEFEIAALKAQGL